MFDQEEAGWGALIRICAIARATPVKIGNTIKIKIEQQKTALQLFNTANIKEDTLRIDYISKSERYNFIEVKFLNKSKNYDQDFGYR